MKRTLIAIALAFSAFTAEAACTTPSLEELPVVPTEQDGFRIALGDVNRDGYPDFASQEFLANEVRIRLGNGDGTFSAPVPYTVPGPAGMAFFDVNGDEWPDLIVATAATKLGVMLNDGDGTFGEVTSFEHGLDNVRTFDAADLDGDDDVDLLIGDHSGHGTHLLWNDGSGGFPTKSSILGPTTPAGAAIAELNNDGRPDVVLAHYPQTQQGSGSIAVYLNSPNGFPATASFSYTFTNPSTILALTKGDLNNDGRPDFAVSFHNGFATYLGSSSGNGSLLNGMSMTMSASAGMTFVDVTMADFTEDGKQDLALANSNGTEQYLIVGLGNGNFQTPPQFRETAYGQVRDVEAADVDRDGRLDLVRFEDSRNEVQIFRNTCAVRFASASVSSSANPATYGQPVTFTAAVSGRTGAPVATGNVSLRIDGTIRETKPLSGGSASFTPISTLSPGFHTVRVEYAGDGDFGAATSPALNQDIVRPPFGVPVAFNAFRFGPTTGAVHMNWVGVQEATGYEIFRMETGGAWTKVFETTGEEAADLMVPEANPQVYAVRAIRTGGAPSALSTPDIATTYVYARPALANQVVRTTELGELRTLINGLRTRVGLGTFTFTDASLAGKFIKAVHVTELRTALQQARAHIGLPAPVYTQPALTPGVTKLKLADVQELRDAIY